MIILEGPDGGGKTTLLNALTQATGLPMHARASDSLTGPVQDLFGWTVADLTTWNEQPLSLYDRHPLISEHIYGPYVRNNVRPGFELTNPAIAEMRKFLRKHAMVVICLPPYAVVEDNARSDDMGQMPGVLDNLRYIYDCYQMMPLMWPSDSMICTYNYMADPDSRTGYNSILAAAKHHLHTWRKPHYVQR